MKEDRILYLLKAAEAALNMCPMHKVHHDDFKNSYEVAAAISKHLKEIAGGECVDGSFIKFEKPGFPFLLTYEIYKRERNFAWFATKEALDKAFEDLEQEYGNDVEILESVEISALRNT